MNGPAITLDRDQLRAWLVDADGGPSAAAGFLGLDDEFGQNTNYGDGIAPKLHEVLRTLQGDGEVDAPSWVWRPRPDVGVVSMWRTCDGDGIDGGAVFIVLLDSNVRVATRHLAHDEWTVDSQTTGVDAAVEAVGTVVALVNRAVQEYDRNR